MTRWQATSLTSLAVALSYGVAAPAAGQVAPPTREEINRIPDQALPPTPPRLTVSGGIERAPCPLDDPRFQAVTVTITQAVFDQLEAVDPAELAPAVAPYLGKTSPISVVCEIRDAAATILRNKGYLAAVQVPPQTIEGGVVHFQVLMAKLVALHVRGNAGNAEKLFAGYLEQLKTGRPFNRFEAERSLLLAGDLPGYNVHLVLKPAGTVPGEVAGDVMVTRTPVELYANIQNYGSRAVGRFSGLARLTVNDLLGIGDRATLGFDNSFDAREQTVVEAGYEIRPGTSGLSLTGRFTYAWTQPTIGGGNPLRARTMVATGELGYPLIRHQAETVRAALGLDVIDQKLRFAGLALNTDKLRVLYGRVDFDAISPDSIGDTRGYNPTEPRWRLSGSLEIRQGLGVLGASRDCGPAPFYLRCAVAPSISRFDANPRAALVRTSASFEFRPTPKIAFVLSPRGQYAVDPVLSYEQMSAGNYTVGRGYDPGALTGDSGIGGSAELRLFSIVPKGANKLALQPYAFVDGVRLWTQGPLAAGNNSRSIYSIGGGLRAAYGDRARLDVTLAAPLSRLPFATKREGVRLLVSFTTRLLPWRPL
ncbi:ShlB/FhaC/HecB family hemolysin secretion/activation protein [Sphingomonas bacterium]|uniref:ShlB/FhaC/HecB family hemolysin secretion/activation protein n=1 Tax=Sphingomonas bacterium TaxID=1895847 RepID=UPI00262131E6|nr:ShlB/FhaC/HecB family hemolysin secretion/activation protein [Sphingomonas bacterium]MDB5678857.1 putative hemolysin activation/secretion protein [Sphingomonas bacterium]